MAADAESLTPTFLVSIVDRYLRSALRKGFLGRRYVVEGDLRFKVGLLSFIDGGVIGHLLRGEPNILRVVATGNLDGPGTIPVETISDTFVESLRVQSSEAMEIFKYGLSGDHRFSTLYILPQVIRETGNLAGADRLRTINNPRFIRSRERSGEEINLALRHRLNSDRVTDLRVAEAFGITECLRGVAVGYHESDIFESCWSASFMSGESEHSDIAYFEGDWSLSVPTDWNGLHLFQRSRVIAGDILSWAKETTPPRMSKSDLAKVQLQAELLVEPP